jgi:acetyl-CoA synthetase (ADP-forming)
MQKQVAIPRSVTRIINSAIEKGRTSLPVNEADEVARSYKIPVPRGKVATSEKDALRVARKIGYPLVMKIVSPEVLHKYEVGGVKVGIETPRDVTRSYREILRNIRKANGKATIEGVYIQKMIPKSYEFVVGGIRDPQFGPTLMFGLGGIYLELFKDVSFRVAPLKQNEAFSMMMENRAARLLTGFRGSKPLDIEDTAKIIMVVGELMNQIPKIESLDINPLLVYEHGVKAVDVRITLGKDSKNH